MRSVYSPRGPSNVLALNRASRHAPTPVELIGSEARVGSGTLLGGDRRKVTCGFKIVAVRIKDEACVVVLVVLRT